MKMPQEKSPPRKLYTITAPIKDILPTIVKRRSNFVRSLQKLVTVFIGIRVVLYNRRKVSPDYSGCATGIPSSCRTLL